MAETNIRAACQTLLATKIIWTHDDDLSMCSATPTMAKYSMVGRYYDRWLQAHEPIDKMARRLNWRAIYVWTVTLARGHPWYWCRPYSSLRPRGINKSTLIFNSLLYVQWHYFWCPHISYFSKISAQILVLLLTLSQANMRGNSFVQPQDFDCNIFIVQRAAIALKIFNQAN